ncbi:MAG: iron-containing redox enzyme family protein [Fimbriimonadaceae bacterium]|nr:iron-containing redox enzyme family protein [Chthonomonadaceae bacterium]MCO5298183.1 iron-containing redox enzyme family protein [Fimbriimonadaceae bacterium]
MSRIQELDAIVARHDLNTHPFYQEWVMGTLPMEKLQDYAAEYGRFVGTIAKGWDTIGEAGYAEEERVHERLWDDFKGAIGAGAPSGRGHTEALVTAADSLFSYRPEAVGALYAFEAQQPITSRSKLDGLNAHYEVSEAGKEYFVVHADDVHEVENLKRRVEAMSDEEFARAKSACSVVCAAMWSALDGVYHRA